MYEPAVDDEISTLVGYLEQQLDAIRAAPYGLTEEQVRETPCRSALSIGGVVKHVAYGLESWLTAFGAEDHAERPLDFAAHAASFALTDDESMTQVLADFDTRRAALILLLRGVDPEERTGAPPQPWFGIHDVRPVRQRYELWHLLEEVARHAGHADIIREQLDGALVPALVLTRAGVPAGDFFTPYEAAPGTLTA